MLINRYKLRIADTMTSTPTSLILVGSCRLMTLSIVMVVGVRGAMTTFLMNCASKKKHTEFCGQSTPPLNGREKKKR